jgi:hypothetical protein
MPLLLPFFPFLSFLGYLSFLYFPSIPLLGSVSVEAQGVLGWSADMGEEW